MQVLRPFPAIIKAISGAKCAPKKPYFPQETLVWYFGLRQNSSGTRFTRNMVCGRIQVQIHATLGVGRWGSTPSPALKSSTIALVTPRFVVRALTALHFGQPSDSPSIIRLPKCAEGTQSVDM